MKRYLVSVLVALMLLGAVGTISTRDAGAASGKKYLMVILTDANSISGRSRMIHAMLHAKELRESGAEVALQFEGAGTQWGRKLRKGKKEMNKLYQELVDAQVAEKICEKCAIDYGAKRGFKDAPFDSANMGHSSIADYVQKGWEILIY